MGKVLYIESPYMGHPRAEASLSFLFGGYEECEPLYSFGPSVRDCYVLHCILSGRGCYYTNDQKYALEAGMGFVLPPEELTFYQADEDDPWTYVWVGMRGRQVGEILAACDIGPQNPIFSYPDAQAAKELVFTMIHHHSARFSEELREVGLCYQFLAKLAENAKPNSFSPADAGNNRYINKAIAFIQDNYQNPIRVKDIADYLCLNRSYLTEIFHKQLGSTPQQFLMEFRMQKASDLLLYSDLPIGVIAYSCGYGDPLAFSKAFKKGRGTTPSEYRHMRGCHDILPRTKENSSGGNHAD